MALRQLNRCGVVAAKHCNLSCTACNHLSPLFKAELLDVETFERVAKTLSRSVKFNALVLQGGEPLLHPQINELLRIGKASGVADKVHVLTNGTFLHKMDDVFWDLVDLVELSVYPGVDLEVPESRKSKIKVSDLQTFTESFSTLHNDDPSLVQHILDRCALFNRCFAISGSYFYKCIISSFIPAQVKHPLMGTETVDGLLIDDRPTLDAELGAYLDSRKPLKSCEFCTGTIGRRFPHTQTKRSEWILRHNRPVREMLERMYMP